MTAQGVCRLEPFQNTIWYLRVLFQMIPKGYGVVKVSHAGVEKSGILALRGGQVAPIKPIIYRVVMVGQPVRVMVKKE